MDYDDFRNAKRRPRPPVYRPAPPYLPPPVVYVPPQPPMQAAPLPPLPPPPCPPCKPKAGINISLRNKNVGTIVDVAAQAFASFAPLPTAPPAPTPPATFDPQNLVTYQTALAQYAKRDEQVRLVGAIARMLFA
jgi:hypothetical protein